MMSAVFAALVAGCGGSGAGAPEVSVPVIEFGPASDTDSMLRASPNGFSFPNFTAASVTGQEFAGADLAAMFGSGPEICASGSGDSCVPTAEAAEWARMVNDSRQSGHCEGFIVLALQRFAEKATPDTEKLATESPVVHGIFRGFSSQFLQTTRDESRAWRGRSVRDVIAELVTSLKDGVPDHVLGLYGKIGGHAVLPYSVIFADKDNAEIGIYDSNWPGQERRVTVDLAKGTWQFSFDGQDPETDPNAWTGGSGDMDLSSLKAHVTGPCPFCDSKTTTTTPTMLAIRASAPTWSLTTSRGTVTPTGQPVQGVDVTKVRASGAGVPAKTDEWVVTVDASEMKQASPVRLAMPAGSTATVVTPRAVARATTGKKASAAFDLTPTTVSTDSRTASVLLANGDRKVTASNKATTLSLDNDGVPVTGTVVSTAPPSNATVTTTKGGSSAATTAPPTGTATTAPPTGTATTAPGAGTTTTVGDSNATTPGTTTATTTTTNPISLTHSFREGGTTGYNNSCAMEILDVTVNGATNVSSVTATVGGTAAPSAMNSSGNDWTFYSMPNKSPGTYTMAVTVNASNGSRTKTLTIVYDNDCDPTN